MIFCFGRGPCNHTLSNQLLSRTHAWATLNPSLTYAEIGVLRRNRTLLNIAGWFWNSNQALKNSKLFFPREQQKSRNLKLIRKFCRAQNELLKTEIKWERIWKTISLVHCRMWTGIQFSNCDFLSLFGILFMLNIVWVVSWWDSPTVAMKWLKSNILLACGCQCNDMLALSFYFNEIACILHLRSDIIWAFPFSLWWPCFQKRLKFCNLCLEGISPKGWDGCLEMTRTLGLVSSRHDKTRGQVPGVQGQYLWWMRNHKTGTEVFMASTHWLMRSSW